MARVLRGEVYWADLNPVRGQEQTGHRPVLIISHGVFNERSGTVMDDLGDIKMLIEAKIS